MKSALYTVALAVLLTRTVPCVAGVADSPLPVLEAGKTTLHLYSVAYPSAESCVRAFFTCTSTDTSPMRVGVELFGPGGGGAANDAVTTSLTVAPGATVTFGTSSAVWFGINSNLGGFGTRSARILATSKKG